MTIKVIGAGFGRTGTLSLKQALEELGFVKCYHMTEVLARPHHARIWEAVTQGEPVDWDRLFKGYQATVDWPGCTFYQELMEHYPDAKVILTVRDPDRWYESVRETIYAIPRIWPEWVRRYSPLRHHARLVNRLLWNDMTFQGRFEDKAFAIDVFNRHMEEVREYIPPERLLVYEVSQGWEPLCQFLDLPVPDSPFPHANDGAQFRVIINVGVWALRALTYGLPVLAALAIIWAIRKGSSEQPPVPDSVRPDA